MLARLDTETLKSAHDQKNKSFNKYAHLKGSSK